MTTRLYHSKGHDETPDDYIFPNATIGTKNVLFEATIYTEITTYIYTNIQLI